jgi:hypothetical protein
MQIDRAIAELKEAIDPGQSCHIEAELAELIQREITLEYRIAWAVKQHRPRKHLRRFQQLTKAIELAA